MVLVEPVEDFANDLGTPFAEDYIARTVSLGNPPATAFHRGLPIRRHG